MTTTDRAMTLRISFDLDETDLRHFRLIMQQTRMAARRRTPEEIVTAAESLISEVRVDRDPGFIVDRIARLRMMIEMISDTEWRPPTDDVARVLNALAYFTEPDDLIPDGIPGLGFLDDAIMIELVLREMRHELEAYADFCAFRAEVPKSDRTRLDQRRKQLQTRMRRRARNSADAGRRVLDRDGDGDQGQ